VVAAGADFIVGRAAAAGNNLVDVTAADNYGCRMGRDYCRDRDHDHTHRNVGCHFQTWQLCCRIACVGVRWWLRVEVQGVSSVVAAVEIGLLAQVMLTSVRRGCDRHGISAAGNAMGRSLPDTTATTGADRRVSRCCRRGNGPVGRHCWTWSLDAAAAASGVALYVLQMGSGAGRAAAAIEYSLDGWPRR